MEFDIYHFGQDMVVDHNFKRLIVVSLLDYRHQVTRNLYEMNSRS